MLQRARRMRTMSVLPRWFWGSVCGLGLISVGICLLYFLKPSNSDPPHSEEANFNHEIKPNESALEPSNAEPRVAINVDSRPTLTFPNNSVEEACRLHEFPPWWDLFDDPDVEDILAPLITSEDCKTALEKHVGAINPNNWGNISKHL